MRDVVVDTCCLINLCAEEQILAPLPGQVVSKRSGRKLDLKLHVPGKVQEEAKYTRQPDPEDSSKIVKAKLDLAPFFAAGMLHACDLGDDVEKELFLKTAAILDDGEAACFAIAKIRRWLIATDERPTERLAKKYGVTIITTPEIIQRWALRTKVSKARLTLVLRNVQTFANYVPRRSLPLYDWWISALAASK